MILTVIHITSKNHPRNRRHTSEFCHSLKWITGVSFLAWNTSTTWNQIFVIFSNKTNTFNFFTWLFLSPAQIIKHSLYKSVVWSECRCKVQWIDQPTPSAITFHVTLCRPALISFSGFSPPKINSFEPLRRKGWLYLFISGCKHLWKRFVVANIIIKALLKKGQKRHKSKNKNKTLN